MSRLRGAQIPRFALAAVAALLVSLGGYSVVSAAGVPASEVASIPAHGSSKTVDGDQSESVRLERLQAECAEWLAANPGATGTRAEFCAKVVSGELPPKPERPTEAEVLARLQVKCGEWLAENPGATGARAEFCASVMAGAIPERVKPEKTQQPERPRAGERLDILKSICTDFLASRAGETSERVEFCKRVLAAKTLGLAISQQGNALQLDEPQQSNRERKAGALKAREQQVEAKQQRAEQAKQQQLRQDAQKRRHQ